MTLIVSIPTEEGAVIAADGQITSGAVRATGEKLRELNSYCAWGGAGEVALIQQVEDTLDQSATAQPLEALRDDLARVVKQSVENLLSLDFRTQFFASDPNKLLQLHQGDFVFVQGAPTPGILHITANGTPEWIRKRPYAIGAGAPFAYALLRKYHPVDLGLERASILAVKVIDEAIDVGAYGLGHPITVWQITPNGGIQPAGQDRMAAFNDAADALRQREIALLSESATQEEREEKAPEAAASGPVGEEAETAEPADS